MSPPFHRWMDGSCLTCSVAENLGLERGEDLSGMIGRRADIFHIQSCNCLKGSQGKPILAVSIKGHPYSGLGHWRLGCIFFLVGSAFWMVVSRYGRRRMERKEPETNGI